MEQHNNGTSLGGLWHNLRMCRERYGLSRKKLAGLVRRTNISSEYIKAVEERKMYPSLAVLGEIAEILCTTAGDLLDGDPLLECMREASEKYDIEKAVRGLYDLYEKKIGKKKHVKISGVDTKHFGKN